MDTRTLAPMRRVSEPLLCFALRCVALLCFAVSAHVRSTVRTLSRPLAQEKEKEKRHPHPSVGHLRTLVLVRKIIQRTAYRHYRILRRGSGVGGNPVGATEFISNPSIDSLCVRMCVSSKSNFSFHSFHSRGWSFLGWFVIHQYCSFVLGRGIWFSFGFSDVLLPLAARLRFFFLFFSLARRMRRRGRGRPSPIG